MLLFVRIFLPTLVLSKNCRHVSTLKCFSLKAAVLSIINQIGDNLAANYSRELADYIVYVIDVSGGDKIPRKGGPGITESDLLVVNKTDLAGIIGADLEVMRVDAERMRDSGPIVFAQVILS